MRPPRPGINSRRLARWVARNKLSARVLAAANATRRLLQLPGVGRLGDLDAEELLSSTRESIVLAHTVVVFFHGDYTARITDTGIFKLRAMERAAFPQETTPNERTTQTY